MRHFRLVVSALALVSCDNAFGPHDRALRVTTDQVMYAEGDAVRITLENRSSEHVTMSGCPNAPATIVDQKLSGRWVDVGAFNATCLAIFTSQSVTLSPGEQWAFTISALDAGVYRLRVFQGSRILGISNDFESR